jgi:hypothetical protein
VPIGTVRSRMFRAREKLRQAGSKGSASRVDLQLEPAPGRGQLVGDREHAVRSLQEETR